MGERIGRIYILNSSERCEYFSNIVCVFYQFFCIHFFPVPNLWQLLCSHSWDFPDQKHLHNCLNQMQKGNTELLQRTSEHYGTRIRNQIITSYAKICGFNDFSKMPLLAKLSLKSMRDCSKGSSTSSFMYAPAKSQQTYSNQKNWLI